MADPFSVIGSAVGVVSLAITTCQGVLSYYNSWDTQDQNISDAKGEIERLRNSFSALEEILPKVSSSSAIATQVEQCVLSCKEGTGRLEQFLGKCLKNPAPLSLIDKLRVCRQRAIFPFRQSSLDSLKITVRDLEGSLGTALQILQLDTSGAQFRQTSELVDLTKSTAVFVEGASQGISNVEQKVDKIIGVLPQIQQGVAQFTSNVPILRSSFTSMEQSMEQRTQAIESFTSRILPDFQTKLDQLPLRIHESLAESTASPRLRPSVEAPGINSIKSAMSTTLTEMDEDARKLQLALAQRPSLLRTVCDTAGGLEMNVKRISTMTAQNRVTQAGRKGKWTKQRPYCSCSTLIRERAANYSIGRVEFFKTSVESCKHSVTCPLYIGIKATTTVGLKMAYYGRLLANTVRATVSVTAGAGGFSISPCLKFRALVPGDSPAFNLLNSERVMYRFGSRPLSQTNEICKYFESALQQLYELFTDGAASPTDMDEDGRTLLHVLDKWPWFLNHCNIEAIQSFRILLMGLVAAEVPLNETDNWGLSALDKLACATMRLGETRHRQKLDDLLMDVSEAGAGHSKAWFHAYPFYQGQWNIVRELELSAKFDGWIEELEITDDRILDEKAFAVYQSLKRRNIAIPSALRPPLFRTTLFHDADLTPALGESLYGRGFMDVDGIDDLGLTPLMELDFPEGASLKAALQRASWLISKGADPGHKSEVGGRRLQDPSITAAHLLCYWVSSAVYWRTVLKRDGLTPEIKHSVECGEIRDEEHLLISKLDALVAEFHAEYTELGVTVPEFLQGYWKARMEEVEREEEPLDDEEIAKIKDMGVVIHSGLRKAHRFK
ncbi:MAG: hypothetical protein Q9175_007111 [Cornicularia normoerica]